MANTLSQTLQAGLEQGIITIATGDVTAAGSDVIATASDVMATEQDVKPIATGLMVAGSDITVAGTNQNEALSDPNNTQGAGNGIQVQKPAKISFFFLFFFPVLLKCTCIQILIKKK